MIGGRPQFTLAGTAAWGRVNAITGEDANTDPFGGFTFAQWHPTLTRIGFHKAIYAHILDNAPRDDGTRQGWVTCPYCNFEYPDSMLNVDHIVDWAQYSLTMTTANNLGNALAWHVYVGCNDPINLRPVCKYCNSSKRNRPVTLAWIAQRQALALARGGFG